MGFTTGSENEKIDKLQDQLNDVLDSQLYSVGGNDNVSIDSSRGARNDAGGDSGGVRSQHPIIHRITDVDTTKTSTGVFDKINLISSMIIVDDPEHTGDIELRFIQGKAKEGAILKLTPKKDRTLVIKSGGNILTSSDIIISDTGYIELVKYSKDETDELIINGAYKINKSISVTPIVFTEPTNKSEADDVFGNGIGTIGIWDNESNTLRMFIKQKNGNWARSDFDYDFLT